MTKENRLIAIGLTHVVKGLARFTTSTQERKDGIAVFGGAAGATDEARRRTKVLQQLYRIFAIEAADASGDISYRETLPPDGWVNEQLSTLGESWRVHNVDGFRCEIYDVQ